MADTRPMRASSGVSVRIPTRRRAGVLQEALGRVMAQTVKPAPIPVCHTKPADIEGLGGLAGIGFLTAAPRPIRKRNAILDRLCIAWQHEIRFDERSLLCAWSEDVDFSHRFGRRRRLGRVAQLAGARGMHLGTEAGRTSRYRLGYSLVASQTNLWRKDCHTLRQAMGKVGRKLAADLVRAVRPELWNDRRGRPPGDLPGVADMVRRPLAPKRIFEL